MPHALRGFSKPSDTPIVKISKTKGWHRYSTDGEVIFDFQMGGSSFTLGYGNDEILSGLESNILNIARCQTNHYNYCDETERAAEIVCGNIWDSYSWALSGTSAVEAAIQINDEYWAARGIDKPYIISFPFTWHGTSYLTKEMGVPRLSHNKSGRCISLERSVDWGKVDLSKVGCIVLELTTWINGVYPWSKEQIETIRNICDEHDILMITDDVAGCWGKSLSYHPYQTFGYGIQPDISALGKSLTAGYAPMGAALCNEKVGSVIREKGSWNYNHTHQPSMAGIYLLLNTYDFIEKYSLIENSSKLESRLKDVCKELLDDKRIISYRTNGLFFSIEIEGPVPHSGLSSSMLGNSIRGCVPLVANEEYFKEFKETFINNIKRIE